MFGLFKTSAPIPSYHDFLAGRFRRFGAAAQAANPLWLFVHVPKTAGSSMNGELWHSLFPRHHIYIDYAKLTPEEARQDYAALFDAYVDRFVVMTQKRRFRYVTGHLNAAQVARICAAVPYAAPVTLLREPVARFISDYRYQCSAMHPGNETFRAACPTIEAYLERPWEHNKIAGSLLPAALREAGDAAVCAAWLMDNYAFIGLQEKYALSLHVLTWLGGAAKAPTFHRRVNPLTEEEAAAMTPALRARIAAANGLDVAIYRAVSERFLAVVPRLTGFLDRVAPIGLGMG
jgi:hypothetical protein